MTKKFSLMVLPIFQESLLLQNINIDSNNNEFWDGFGSFYKNSDIPIDIAVKVYKNNFKEEIETVKLLEVGHINFHIQKPEELINLATIIYFVNINEEDVISVNKNKASKWFKINEIPYQRMHPTTGKWLPIILKAKKLVEFEFKVDQNNPADDNKMQILEFKYR